MNVILRVNFLLVCVCFALSARLFAAETNSVTNSVSPAVDVVAQNLLNGYLQLQEQLHAAQLAIADGRQEAAAEAKRNADELTVRIQTLEQTIAEQRAREVEMAQKNQRAMLMLAGAFGLIVLAAVLFMAYLQWRAVTRVMESSLLQMQNFSLGNGRAAPSLVTGAAQANARLFSAVDLLQKRILELEDGSRHALTGKISSASGNGIVNPNDRDKTVANLLAEGQTFLNSGEAEKALDCFDGALKLEPKHAEALVRKGSALEKLARLDEAIAYYDLAIEADASMTKAYLQKGGLFNGMARYDEALQCYEQALRAKEKKPAA